MRGLLFIILMAWASSAAAQTQPGATVNPATGSVWTYFGPTFGADWAPVTPGNGMQMWAQGGTWLIADFPNTIPYHEGMGGDIIFNGHLKVNGDHIWIETGDMSLYTAARLAGTPTAGEVFGIDWLVEGVVYPVRVTVAAGQTNQQLATALCLATDAQSSLMTVLRSYKVAGDQMGYGPTQAGCSNQIQGNQWLFNYPWGTTISAVNSAHTTIEICSPLLAGCQTPRMDGGPFIVITRDFPNGYTVNNGDQLGIIYFQDRGGGSIGFNQTGAIAQQYINNTGSAKMIFNNMGTSFLSKTVFDIQNGINLYRDGDRCIGSDGDGLLSACGVRSGTYWIGQDPVPTIGRVGGGTVFSAQAGESMVFGSFLGAAQILVNPTSLQLVPNQTTTVGGGLKALCTEASGTVYVSSGATC